MLPPKGSLAVHPIHTEAVTWIAGLPEVSFTFFSLVSFYFYLRSRESFRGAYVLSVVSFALAAFCKETAMVLPIIFIIYDYAFRKEGSRLSDYLKLYISYFAVAGGYLILRFHALGGFSPQPSHIKLNAYGYIINVFPLFVDYLGRLLLPINLNAFHVFHPIASIFDAKGLLALTVTAAFVILSYISSKKNKVVFFCFMIIVVPLLPVLYIAALGENTFAERYLYLPSLAFAVLSAFFIARVTATISRGTVILAIANIALIGVYSIETVARNRIWKDDYILYSDMARKSSDAAIPRDNLGYVLAERGRIDEAIEQFEIALKLDPNLAEAHNNFGNAHDKKGRIDEAIEQYKIALKLNPDFEEVHVNLGNVYGKSGRIDEAIEQYTIAVKLNPDSAEIHNNLGNAYGNKGWVNEAIEQYTIDVKLNPSSAETHNNLGNAYGNKGWIDKAMEQFEIAVKLNPSSAEAHYNLGVLFKKKGLEVEAKKEFETAIRIKPSLVKTR